MICVRVTDERDGGMWWYVEALTHSQAYAHEAYTHIDTQQGKTMALGRDVCEQVSPSRWKGGGIGVMVVPRTGASEW